ncbi:MAG: hypothetical protein GY768_27910 [Planctomycetaceae bacterium]|nr:hypothetical protein [Planctomycetaceae bacterium]
MPLNDRLKTRVKRFTTAATAAAVTGNLASDADASLHIWDVGQTGTPVNTVTLTANFQSNFQLAFRGTTWHSHGTTSSVSSSNYGWAVLMDSRSNLSHLNEAKWNSGLMIGADANNGLTSAGVDGRTAHAWERGQAHKHGFSTFYLSSMVPGVESGSFRWGPWRPTPANGYLGIRFEEEGEYYYGWVELTVRDWGQIDIVRWALEDEAGVAAMTGDPVAPETIPEPASIAIWAIGAGAVGLRALRRRRQNANDQVS